MDQAVTDYRFRSYIISIMAPDHSPATQVQFPPLPAKYSAATVSSPAFQYDAKITLQYILKKLSNKK